MKNDTPNHWQDWAVFGTRVVLLLTIALAVYLLRSRTAPITAYEPFIIPAAVTIVTNLLLVAVMYIPPAKPAVPFVAVAGDLAVAAALGNLVGNQPLFLAVIAFTLSVSSLLRVGWMWGALAVVGVFLATGIAVGVNDRPFVDELFRGYVPLLIATVGGTIAVGVWIFQRDENSSGQQKHLNEITRLKEAELNDMRDRTRAVSDMATTLNGTLNYEKILDAALDIGRVSVRKEGKSNRVVSMVLLFRAQDEALYIANSRGLSHNDLHRVFRGDSGIVGRTLEKCLPIISKETSKDPELSQFVALQGMRSTLCIPLRAGYDNFGVVLYASDVPNAFDEDRIEALMAIGTQATIALQNAVLYRSLMEEKERIIEMEENARKGLVRDLHDVPTQTVSAVAMRLRIIQKLYERGSDEIMDELKTVEGMALRATEEIRHVLFKLRPLALESQGLTAALNQLAEKLIKTYKQNMAVKVGSDVETHLDQSAQGVIFYLIEEAVNNARKYAEAQLITVQVGRKGGVVIVRIADNGKGFDVAAVAGDEKRSSYGMTNMRERAELLDGTIKLESTPGIGTTITVTIPIPEKSRSENRSAGSNGATQPKQPQTKLAATASARLNST